MDEELKLFLRKAAKLQNILDNIKPEEWKMCKETLEILKAKTSKILALVHKDSTLNAGGKFEWVDSILIKVVQLFNA